MIDAECIFCKIVAGDIPNYTLWENDTHLAFLTPFPNTAGHTVVVPKKHHSSYVFEAEAEVVNDLTAAAKQVARLIDSNLEDVGRCGMLFDGFGVDHLHAQLIPMHGTADMMNWKPRAAPVKTFFEQYEGYISSHDGDPADKKILEELVAKIRGKN